MSERLMIWGKDKLEQSPWFDADWYRGQYPDVAWSGMSPEEHYLRLGESWGRCPGPHFDPEWYLAQYPDVAQVGMSPLLHFILHGETEGRLPCELQAQAWDVALWAQQVSAATCLQALEALQNSGSLPEASLAGFAMARWHAGQGDWQAAGDCLARRPAGELALPRHVGPLLLAVEAFGRSGQLAIAWQAMSALQRRAAALVDTHLAVSNLLAWQGEYLPEAPAFLQLEWQQQRLGWINAAWRQHGLGTIGLANTAHALGLDNLHGHAAGRGPGRESQASPLVSVIVPVYNAADTLPTALRSLAEQRDVELEVIVVDDASDDASASVVDAFAERDARFRVLRQPVNQGAYAARNRGVAEARGDLITVHDSDDWSHPEKLATQVRGLMRHPEWMACCSHWVRTSPALIFSCWRMEQGWSYRNVSSLMFRRRVFETLGYWDEVRAEADTEYYYRIRAAFGIQSVGEVLPGVPLSFGRQVEDSLTSVGRTHLVTQFHGARADYRRASQSWHAQARDPADLFLPRKPEQRPFEVPAVLLP
ncbi:glycosyltransferase family 2 protein [Halomonas elongata]|uniref:glycosyltransferase family 2 protein n=1 Tax=Halomonas elongata TaxID=2746 RepID=UPI004033DC4D